MASRHRSRTGSEARAPGRVSLVLAGVLAGALSVGLSPALAGDPMDFAVIVSPDVRVESLTFEDLQRVFRFQKRYWGPGRPVNVLLPADGSAAHEFLLSKIVGVSDGALHRAIVGKLYRGELDRAPGTAASDAEALGIASNGRGLITLVVADSGHPPGVHVLAVDRLRPGEAGYPLRQ